MTGGTNDLQNTLAGASAKQRTASSNVWRTFQGKAPNIQIFICLIYFTTWTFLTALKLIGSSSSNPSIPNCVTLAACYFQCRPEDARPSRRRVIGLIHRDVQCLLEPQIAGVRVHHTNAIRPVAMETIQGADLDLYHAREHTLEVEAEPEAGVQALVDVKAGLLAELLRPREHPKEAPRFVPNCLPFLLIWIHC